MKGVAIGRGQFDAGEAAAMHEVGDVHAQASRDEQDDRATPLQFARKRQAALHMAETDGGRSVDPERDTHGHESQRTLNKGTSGSQRSVARSVPESSAWPIKGNTSA